MILLRWSGNVFALTFLELTTSTSDDKTSFGGEIVSHRKVLTGSRSTRVIFIHQLGKVFAVDPVFEGVFGGQDGLIEIWAFFFCEFTKNVANNGPVLRMIDSNLNPVKFISP